MSSKWMEHVKKYADFKLKPKLYADKTFTDEEGKKYYMFFVQKRFDKTDKPAH
ncbi:hypothetical protein D3C78_1564820 [compost metagenome]